MQTLTATLPVNNSDLVVEQVDIARAFEPPTRDMIICPAAVHITVDPISGAYQFAVFTDDGAGNGDHILTLYVREQDA